MNKKIEKCVFENVDHLPLVLLGSLVSYDPDISHLAAIIHFKKFININFLRLQVKINNEDGAVLALRLLLLLLSLFYDSFALLFFLSKEVFVALFLAPCFLGGAAFCTFARIPLMAPSIATMTFMTLI